MFVGEGPESGRSAVLTGPSRALVYEDMNVIR